MHTRARTHRWRSAWRPTTEFTTWCLPPLRPCASGWTSLSPGLKDTCISWSEQTQPPTPPPPMVRSSYHILTTDSQMTNQQEISSPPVPSLPQRQSNVTGQDWESVTLAQYPPGFYLYSHFHFGLTSVSPILSSSSGADAMVIWYFSLAGNYFLWRIRCPVSLVHLERTI